VEGDVKSSRYKTQRGFTKIEFDDGHGDRCSIQESSSVVSHVWVGIPHDAGLIYQLLAIVIVGAKSYFT
jgi:hypothetical protein